MSTSLKFERGSSAALVATGSAPGNATLATASKAFSAEYDNSTNLYLFGDVEIACTFGSAPAAGSLINLYLVPCEDGTNYADGDATIAPPSNYLVGQFILRNVNTAQRVVTRGFQNAGISLPPSKFKVVIENIAGQTISTSWAVTLFPYRYQNV